jgi:hypothetical protein
MKTLLLALAATVVATTVMAQSAAPPDRPGRDSYDRRDMFDRRDGGGREGPGGGWRDDMHHFGMMGGGRMGMREGGQRGGGGGSGGAHFRFQRGDARIDIRCGDNEPMSLCVDGASRLIDKVMSMRPAGGGDASLPAPAPPTAAPARPGAGAPDSLPRPQ